MIPPLASQEWCARSESDGAVPVQKCSEVSVTLRMDQRQVAARDSLGRKYFPRVWAVMGPKDGPRDSALTGPDGRNNLNSRYVGMANVPVCFRGDADLKWMCGLTGPEYWRTSAIPMIARIRTTPVCATSGPAVSVPIDYRKAYTVPLPTPEQPTNFSFYHRVMHPDGRGWLYMDGGWLQFPAKVGFNEDPPAGFLARFQAEVLDSMNRAYCQERVVLASKSEAADSGILVFIKDNVLAASFGGLVRDWWTGSITMDSSYLRKYGPQGAHHELSHAIPAVGHTCMWLSNMRTAGCPPVTSPTPIQKQDIAYVLSAEDLLALRREYNSDIGRAWVYNGEREERDEPWDAFYWVGADGLQGSLSAPGAPFASLSLAAIQSPPRRELPKNLIPRIVHEHFPRLK
ncbi:MAG: hypothetical protein AAB500_00285 [Patescibacteria group bacterium]